MSCDAAASCLAQDEAFDEMAAQVYFEQGRRAECVKRSQMLSERLADTEAANLATEEQARKDAAKAERKRRVWVVIAAFIGASIGFSAGRMGR